MGTQVAERIDQLTEQPTDPAEALREEILAKVAEYYRLKYADQPFAPGQTRVQYAGRVFDEQEMMHAADAVLDFRLTHGRFGQAFERKLGAFLGLREIIPVNSGSSANLVAVTTLCARQLRNGLRPGDEVITPAVTFPTTLAPIVQNRLVPVLVDCQLGNYNIDVDQLEAARSDRTRAVFAPHTLGNPIDMDRLVAFCRQHNLFLIEDTCDALGSTFDGKLVGAFGHFGTLSCYPAHHITTGEGGVVFTNSLRLARLARTIRDWGRDCFCNYDNPPNGKCGHRLDWKIPGSSEPYDHRYLYTEIGYNLKMTELQAAIGVAQVDKLPMFIEKRKQHFRLIDAGLRRYEEHLLLPTQHPKADPSWFAFPLTVRPGAPFTRKQITQFLEDHKVETRYLFSGNILQQPGYRDIERRVVGSLPNSDIVLKGAFFVGVYPGLDQARIDYLLGVFHDFFANL
ncbi:MAG TPA: lipopolysaccharide biosynthesis protein RfbH [Anaerolineae bacterium]|nr:lipopolysaccharide biosynthesis protein RfbH [Anaerolineae bacterium]